MGTNFYARKKPTEKEKATLLKKLEDCLEGNETKENFIEKFEEIFKEIHLGKRSYGWQFLWQSHPELYGDSLSEIMEFILTKGYEIYDEYGGKFTLSEFIEDELGETLYKGCTYDNITSRTAIPSDHHDYISKDGLRFVKGDFS